MLMLVLIHHIHYMNINLGWKNSISIQFQWVGCCNISFTKDDRSSETLIENCQTCHIEGEQFIKIDA